MRALVLGLLLAFLIPTKPAYSQQARWPTTPIDSCPEVANSYTNYGFVININLVLRSDCTYEIQARGQKGIGTATLSEGTLILPFNRPQGSANERFELRRSWTNLNGTVIKDGTPYEISFHPVK
jgi:hypothetical protein